LGLIKTDHCGLQVIGLCSIQWNFVHSMVYLSAAIMYYLWLIFIWGLLSSKAL